MANIFQRSKKLEVSSISDDKNCATVILHDEDHTLGNSLRYMLMKNPAVKFCGYSMPHPNERKVILQIQTYSQKECDASKAKKPKQKSGDENREQLKDESPEECSSERSFEESVTGKSNQQKVKEKPKKEVIYQTAMECFEKGLRDLIDISEHIRAIFETKYEQFEESKNVEMAA